MDPDVDLEISSAGDGDYKPYVSSEPDVTTVEMDGSEDFLIVACDGLWDTVTPEEAAETVFQTLKESQGEYSREESHIPIMTNERERRERSRVKRIWKVRAGCKCRASTDRAAGRPCERASE